MASLQCYNKIMVNEMTLFEDVLYRNATDFCMLILYSAALLNLLIMPNRFFV